MWNEQEHYAEDPFCSGSVSVTWRRWSQSHAEPLCLTEGTACSPFILPHAFIFHFHIQKKTGKISWNYILPPFSIQFPIFPAAPSPRCVIPFLFVPVMRSWAEIGVTHPRALHALPNRPLSSHHKNGCAKIQFSLSPLSHTRRCSFRHLHTRHIQ